MSWLRYAFLLLFLGLSLQAEAPFETLFRQTHPAFRVHAHRTPFPSTLVSALTLDQEGCVWAGTVAGLAKYDGRGWQPVMTPLPAWRTWVNNNALGVLEDGTLWCGTRAEGLLLHKKGQWTRLGKEDGLPSNAINGLLESRSKDRAGKRILYVGTYGGGLARLQDGKWEVLDHQNGLVSNHIFALAEDPQGRLWVGTRGGISILEGDSFRPFERMTSLPDAEVRQLLWITGVDGSPALWIGPIRGGPCLWYQGRLQRFPIGARGVSNIIPAWGGGVWVSFWGGGLARWDGRHWQTWGKEDGLPSAHLRCLLEVVEDGRSVIWIGSDGRGIFRTSEGGWRQFQPRWTGELEVRTFAEGSDGSVWMAGRNFGLLQFDGAKWKRWDVPTHPVTGDIRCIAWWRGQLWAGCDIELAKLGPKELEVVGPGTLLDHRIIRCLLPSPGRLWIGTSLGLMSWDGERAEAFPLFTGASNASVRSLAMMGGELWVGTDGGLFKRQADGTVVAIPSFTEGEGILSLASDGMAIWIGTSAGRILTWRAGRLETLGSGEAGAAVLSLVVGGGGNRLFAGTIRGVETWDLQTGKLRARHPAEDGLPDDECLPGALFEDSTGRIWAGTGHGAGVFDSAGPQPRPSPKNLNLAGSFSSSGPREPGSTLPRGETWLHVDFALRAHHREEDTRYRTQLLPMESAPGDWNAESHRRLQGLPRGKYTLRIWAKDYQEQESGPIEFPFKVLGRAWEHPLFLWMVGTLLLATGGLLARSRMAARQRALEEAVHRATSTLIQQKADLEELARQQGEIMGIVAHDIRNPLSGIALVTELLEDETDEEQRQKGYQRIKGAVGSVTALLNQFLNMQSIEAGTIDLHLRPSPLGILVQEVIESFQMLAVGKGQSLSLEADERWVLVDGQVFKEVVSNLVSNALKYSPPDTEVRIRMEAGSEGRVRLAVVDQGPGLTEADKAKLFQRFSRLSAQPTGGEHSVGLGLAISKRWVEAMGGRIGAEGEPGKGSMFWVELLECPPG